MLGALGSVTDATVGLRDNRLDKQAATARTTIYAVHNLEKAPPWRVLDVMITVGLRCER